MSTIPGLPHARSTGVPPVSRMGFQPMQPWQREGILVMRDHRHGLEARATHGRDAHATGECNRPEVFRQGDYGNFRNVPRLGDTQSRSLK